MNANEHFGYLNNLVRCLNYLMFIVLVIDIMACFPGVNMNFDTDSNQYPKVV